MAGKNLGISVWFVFCGSGDVSLHNGDKSGRGEFEDSNEIHKPANLTTQAGKRDGRTDRSLAANSDSVDGGRERTPRGNVLVALVWFPAGCNGDQAGIGEFVLDIHLSVAWCGRVVDGQDVPGYQ